MVNFAHLGQRVRGWPLPLEKRPGAGNYRIRLPAVLPEPPETCATMFSDGRLHTFRNARTTTGKMLVFVTPAGMEKYQEEISVLTMPQDVEQWMAISAHYGIAFAQ